MHMETVEYVEMKKWLYHEM